MSWDTVYGGDTTDDYSAPLSASQPQQIDQSYQSPFAKTGLQGYSGFSAAPIGELAPQAPVSAQPSYSGSNFGGSLGWNPSPAPTNPGFSDIAGLASQTTSDAGSGLSSAANAVQGVSSLAVLIPGVGPILAGIGTIASGVMSYFAQKDQERAQQDAQNKQLELYQQAQAEDTRRYNQQAGMAETAQADQLKTNAQNRSIQAQTFALSKQQLAMNNQAQALAKMTLFMNTPTSRGQFASIFKGR